MHGDVNNQKPVNVPFTPQPNHAGIPSGSAGPGGSAGIGDSSMHGGNVNNMTDPGDSSNSSSKGSM
jgi:hypothetical protein